MESTQGTLRMNEEAKETTLRIIKHIINPLHEDDRYHIVDQLCEEYEVRIHDRY